MTSERVSNQIYSRKLRETVLVQKVDEPRNHNPDIAHAPSSSGKRRLSSGVPIDNFKFEVEIKKF